MGAAKVGCGTHPLEKVRIGGERHTEREREWSNKQGYIYTFPPLFFELH